MAPSTIPLLLSFGFGALFLFLGHFVGRRRFYRRNPFGREVFPNYRTAVLTAMFERMLETIGALSGGVWLGLFLMFAMMRCGESYDTSSPRDNEVHARATRHDRGANTSTVVKAQ